jgi:hypothetical protein
MAPYLSICAIYRDEAPYLREWIEFHRLVGVEHFFLYDNGSADDHRAALAPYLDRGLVTLHDWPRVPGQLHAYRHCLESHEANSRWIAFLDLDEFLFSPTGRLLTSVLPDYERWPGIVVNWATYGSSGHRTRPAGLVIESYRHRAGGEHRIARYVKSIVDPGFAESTVSPHWFEYREGFAVDENFERWDGAVNKVADRVSFSRLRVNHYWTKSDEEFRRKQARPDASYNLPREPRDVQAIERICNEVLDESLARYAPRVHAALAETDALARV